MLPSRVHAIVLISKLHKPAMRAVAYARATRPTFLEAITVDVDPEDTETLRNEWARREIPVPLKVLSSPYREITRPIIEYVHSLRTGNPRDVVIVYIPEYVLGRWYEQVLHNQSALRLKARLLFTPGVMVASVPWQLRSSEGAEDDDFDGPVVGSVRRRTRADGRPASVGDRGGRRGRPGRPRRALRRPARRSRGLRAARPPRRAGPGRASPRATTTAGSSAATPSRSSTPPRTGSTPPCPYAGPGRCGGCDFQHADLAYQRQLKAEVVREQFQRLAAPRGRGGPLRRSRVTTAGSAGGRGSSSPSTPTAVRGCVSTGPTPSCPSRTA